MHTEHCTLNTAHSLLKIQRREKKLWHVVCNTIIKLLLITHAAFSTQRRFLTKNLQFPQLKIYISTLKYISLCKPNLLRIRQSQFLHKNVFAGLNDIRSWVQFSAA
jgi:hypothetical protein